MPYSTSKPDKETLQQYLERRHKDRNAPPEPAEIRRQLGWSMRPEDDLTAADRLALPER